MDPKELQEKIALYYSKLPPKAQQVFGSMAWLENLKTISQKYGLDEKQKEVLGTETTLVLLGIIHLVEYEENLTNEMGLSPDSADKIMDEIEATIIKYIRPELVQAFEENTKEESAEKTEVSQKSEAQFKNLSKEIGDVVKDSNYQTTLYTIGREHNLTILQMGLLEKSVTDLINGSIRPNGFENSLGGLKLPPEKLTKLVNDVNEKIFKTIRNDLIKSTSPSPYDENFSVKQKNDKILGSAGIKVIPSKAAVPDLSLLELEGSREDMLKKIEQPDIHPILAQKLSGSMQMPKTETQHKLENITKAPAAPIKANLPQKPYQNKADPYRELPQ